MKKKIIGIIAVLLIIFSNAISQESNKAIAISADKTNVVYIGLENPVTIAVAGVKSENTLVTIKNGTILKKGDAEYIIKPDVSAREVILTIAEKKDGKMIQVGSKTLRVKRVPPPVAVIDEINSGIISKSKISEETELKTVMVGFDFEGINFKITSFEFYLSSPIKDENGKENFVIKCSIPSTGSKFNPKIINCIKDAVPGSKVFFDDIKVVGPDGASRTLNPLIMTIFE